MPPLLAAWADGVHHSLGPMPWRHVGPTDPARCTRNRVPPVVAPIAPLAPRLSGSAAAARTVADLHPVHDIRPLRGGCRPGEAAGLPVSGVALWGSRRHDHPARGVGEVVARPRAGHLK